mmetsp:Transcript_2458/g.4893  ORF Transcript_2458/g.4893 Transcript_2458/m.4893 type:complete len:209 (-) Transcript_2458:1282-1908(-)
MNVSSLSLSSPLIGDSPVVPNIRSSTEGSPTNYNSTKDAPGRLDTTTKSQYMESSALDYEGDNDNDGMRSDVSVADTNIDSRTTVNQTFIHLLKGNVGPGCLSLPWAVSQIGFVGGTIAIAIMAFWSSYNCWTIVKIKRYIERGNLQRLRAGIVDGIETKSEGASSIASSALTYPDVGGWAYGDKFEQFISGCVCVQQLVRFHVYLLQ